MKINKERLIENREYCEEVLQRFLNIKAIKKDESRLFKKYLDKAVNNLEFANFILEEHKHSIKEKIPNKHFYDWCIVIYYYSLYHSALALVSRAGFESKNHLATITALTLFYYHRYDLLKKEEIEFLMNSLVIEKQEINLIMETKDMRERASYGVEAFEERQAESLRKETADFITKCREILDIEK